MKLDVSPYEITFKGKRGIRQGALLRFFFADLGYGYADCHVWEELGDLSLKRQLQLLIQDQMTPITEQAFFFAKLDAEARSEGRSLFTGLSIPQSHFLILDMEDYPSLEKAIQAGFTHFKVKMGMELEKELVQLKRLLECSEVKVRIDFNERLTLPRYEWFLEQMGTNLNRVDFIEDPIPFEESIWMKLQKKYPVSLACDRKCDQAFDRAEVARVIVIKPSIQKYSPKEVSQRVVITSYLGHPLGQSAAAYSAALFQKKFPVDICGLLSHQVYESTPFSEELTCQGPYLMPCRGTGFGFDQLLEKLRWQPITSI